MPTERLSLPYLCGLKECPSNTLEWHKAILAGFPKIAISRVAKCLGVSPKHLQERLNPESLRSPKLTPRVSDYLHRIAVACVRLSLKTNTAEELQTWLRTAQPDLRDEIPVLVLETTVGANAVYTLIDRIAVSAPKVEHAQDAPDVDEAEFEHKFADDYDDAAIENTGDSDSEDDAVDTDVESTDKALNR